jgi:hypothetical protein
MMESLFFFPFEFSTALTNRGVGVFFSRQADRSCASNGQRAIAAEKGKTQRRLLLE